MKNINKKHNSHDWEKYIPYEPSEKKLGMKIRCKKCNLMSDGRVVAVSCKGKNVLR